MSQDNVETQPAVCSRPSKSVTSPESSLLILRLSSARLHRSFMAACTTASKRRGRHASGYAQAWAAVLVGLPTWLLTRCSETRGNMRWSSGWRGSASDGRKLDLPAVSIYKMRDGKIVESQLFHADTKAILNSDGAK